MELQMISKKIEIRKEELKKLKTILKQNPKKSKISLKGLLKGMTITEKDIQEAKKSLLHHDFRT